MRTFDQAQSAPAPSGFMRLANLAALIFLLAALAAGVLLVRQNLPPYARDLTSEWSEDRLNLIGIYSLEQNADFKYRWSAPYAFVVLPHGYHAAESFIASIRIRSSGQRPLTFLLNERPLAVVDPGQEFRNYRMILPPAVDPEATMRFAIETPALNSPGDTRRLGVILTNVALLPLASSAWPVAALLTIALLILWAGLRWMGTPPGADLLITAVSGVALLALYALYQPSPLPYEWYALLAIAGALLGAMLARELLSRLALAILSILMSFSGVLWPSWLTDDAFISFRYAANLVAGHGLVFNPDERVEGYTNFLWTLLAALVIWLGGDLALWSYLAGVLLGLAIMLLAYALARWLLGPAWALVAALLVATSQSVLVYTARGAGLETGLFTLLVLAGSTLAIRRKHVLAGVILALATLTRPEGVLVLGATLLYAALADGWKRADETMPAFVLRRSSYALRLALPYLAIMLPFFVWRYTYYGDLLPNTFYAKTGGGLRQALRGLEYAGKFVLAMGGPLVLLAFAPLLSLKGRRAWAERIWQLYLLLLVTGYSAYIIVVGGDHFPGERFFVPLVPWLAILIAGGLASLYARVQAIGTLARRLAPAGLAALLTLYSFYALQRSATFDLVISGNNESLGIWREIGLWLHDTTPPDTSVAAMGIGAIAYYSDRTTIDMLGLTDRHIARVQVPDMGEGTAGHEKHDPAYVLDQRQPTYIPKMWEDYFGGEQALRGLYEPYTIHTRYGREIRMWRRLP